ncbi:MAG: hypothetical protein K0S39_5754 [Paenibacillus sp.]|nr:hypothetical protein [Paenibacillus sp.]
MSNGDADFSLLMFPQARPAVLQILCIHIDADNNQISLARICSTVPIHLFPANCIRCMELSLSRGVVFADSVTDLDQMVFGYEIAFINEQQVGYFDRLLSVRTSSRSDAKILLYSSTFSASTTVSQLVISATMNNYPE